MSWSKLKYHIWCIISCTIWYDAPFRRYNLLKVMWLWFDLERLSNVKCLQVNWYFIDDFLYVFPINYGQNVLSLWNIASWKPNDLWFVLSISSKVKCYKVNWKVIYDLLYVFHTNFDHVMHHLWETCQLKGQLKDHIWLCICASQFVVTILGKLHAKIEETLHNRFRINWQ